MVELHGKAPYKTVLIHCSPGAIGSLKGFSEEFSELTGIGGHRSNSIKVFYS